MFEHLVNVAFGVGLPSEKIADVGHLVDLSFADLDDAAPPHPDGLEVEFDVDLLAFESLSKFLFVFIHRTLNGVIDESVFDERHKLVFDSPRPIRPQVEHPRRHTLHLHQRLIEVFAHLHHWRRREDIKVPDDVVRGELNHILDLL